MYEMYPNAWAVADTQPAAEQRPRRRPRKTHSVLPAVIARQLDLTDSRRPLG